MYFEINSEQDLSELGVDFAKSQDQQDVFEFLSGAFGAMDKEDRKNFLSYATEFHEFKKQFEGIENDNS